MSPDPFDEIDRALASGLSALAPDVGVDDETLASLRPRFRRARTRARVAKIGGAVVALLAIGSVATLAAPSSNRSHVNVGGHGSTPQTTHPLGSTTTPAPTTPAPIGRRGSTPPTSAAPGAGGSVPTPGSAPPERATVPVTTPGPQDHGGGPGPSDGGHGHGSGESSTTTSAPAPDDYTFQSSGGGITVRFAHGALQLIGVTPAAGYGYDVHHNDPDRVEVRFSLRGEQQARIEVQVEDGHVVRTDDNGH